MHKATVAAIAGKQAALSAQAQAEAAAAEAKIANDKNAVINTLEQEQNLRRAYASKLVEKLSASDCTRALDHEGGALMAREVYDVATALAREDMRRSYEELIGVLDKMGKPPSWPTMQTCDRLGVKYTPPPPTEEAAPSPSLVKE